MTYDDFEVRIFSSRGDRLLIRVDCSAGEGAVEVVPELGPVESRRLFGDFQAAAERAGSVAVGVTPSRHLTAVGAPQQTRDLTELGRRLFSFLFPPELRRLWDQCRGRSANLRLRIHLDLTRRELAWLGALPWELLYDQDSGGFLALDGRTPVVRYLDVRQDRRPFPRTRPWRVLVVMAEPQGLRPLDLGAERKQLLETWENVADVQPLFPEKPTFDDIHRELARAPVHAIHYMGHGVFDENTGWGGLMLETASGGSAPLLGPAMKKLVKGVEPPALVVLNGCETGRTGGDGPEPFGGAAAALMDAGVSAVVAMQLPVADEVAVHFSRILYRALQDEHPVDWAVSEARLSLSEAFRDRPDWAIPSLFMRVPDGRLLEGEEVRTPQGERRSVDKAKEVAIYDGPVEDSTIDHTGIRLSGPAASDSGVRCAESITNFKGKIKNSYISNTGINIQRKS